MLEKGKSKRYDSFYMVPGGTAISKEFNELEGVNHSIG
jgi:hypothetical protein